MYLSVQLAARRLGVSPHTIRRWTASGFLPCTRTAGGHRRMKQEDIDELSHLIGGRNHLAARLVRERELETLVKTAITVSSQLDVTDLLREIAKQMTSLLDTHFCVISDFDARTRTVSVLADYDDLGNRRPDTMTYTLNQFPVARKAIEEHESVTVNVSDPHADAAEVAIMRRDGDKCLLVLPMLHQGQAIGLLEVLDHERERRFTRQEMRLANAVAGQASVALHNAQVFAQLERSDQDVLTLRHAIEKISADYASCARRPRPRRCCKPQPSWRRRPSRPCHASQATEAKAPAPPALSAGVANQRSTQSNTAHVIVSSAPCGDDQIALTLTLGTAACEGQAELLGLISTMAAGVLAELASG